MCFDDGDIECDQNEGGVVLKMSGVQSRIAYISLERKRGDQRLGKKCEG